MMLSRKVGWSLLNKTRSFGFRMEWSVLPARLIDLLLKYRCLELKSHIIMSLSCWSRWWKR